MTCLYGTPEAQESWKDSEEVKVPEAVKKHSMDALTPGMTQKRSQLVKIIMEFKAKHDEPRHGDETTQVQRTTAR